MSLPDPTGPDEGGKKDGPINTVDLGKITVFGYTMEANIFAAICYLPIPPANIIPCVIALNTASANPQFIRFNAVQSLILSGGFFAISTVLSALMGALGLIPLIGGLINMVLGLAMFLLVAVYMLASLKLCVSAFLGQTFDLPVIGPYARKYSKT
jgi:uncharacterized membrane protein